jgi:hypothetical protein
MGKQTIAFPGPFWPLVEIILLYGAQCSKQFSDIVVIQPNEHAINK